MKNTSFKRIWTKTSVKRILKEFEKTDKQFLCHVSDEFKNIWSDLDHRLKIRDLAKKIDTDHWRVNSEMFPSSTSCLFYFMLGRTDGHSIRIKFLEHEIKRLSRKRR